MEPTARADYVAQKMREYYEANRESWWQRRRKRWQRGADNLMLGLINVAVRATNETEASARAYDEANRQYGARRHGH